MASLAMVERLKAVAGAAVRGALVRYESQTQYFVKIEDLADLDIEKARHFARGLRTAVFVAGLVAGVVVGLLWGRVFWNR